VTAGDLVVLAHGIVGREDLPIPRWLFLYAAVAVLVASFAGLAALWPRPRLEGARARVIARVPRALEVLAGAAGIALLAVVVYAGLAGTQSVTANLAPTFVFVLFWVGVPVLSALAGDVFRAVNPWRAIARAVAWAAGRAAGGADRLPAPLPYPERLGRWPAAATILAFVWVELVFAGRDDPSTLAVLVLAYAALQLVGMALYGIEPWTRNADGFSVLFGLFAALSPLRWADRALALRPPLSGLTEVRAVPGTVALLVVAIGTTSYDGFSGGELWGGVARDLQTAFVDLGLNGVRALELAETAGLVGMVLLVGLLFRLGVAGMRTVDRARAGTGAGLAGRFVHSLVPIAFAYVLAHYFSLLATQGQATAYLASDPLGTGANLFGTATATIDYGVLSANAIWYVQVASLLVGHVAGLVLAHDRALLVFGDSRAATRSQYWMLAVMIAFTSLGLWLLSAESG
jgi:hypothetical protein